MDYEPNFEAAFGMIKEMRRILRHTDFTKTVRRRWSTTVMLIEIDLMGLEADARRTQPIKIRQHLTDVSSIVSAVKAGEAPLREARLAVAKARSFFRRTQPSTSRDRGSMRLKQMVEELKALQREHVTPKTSNKQKEEK